jgi:hypothetical protein
MFSPSGMFVACRGQLLTWPALTEVARGLGGIPVAWGSLDGREMLLVQSGRGTYAVIDTAGTQLEVDVGGLQGRVVASWSPMSDAVWLQSGLQTSVLRLNAWTPGGRAELASLPNSSGATNIAASSNESWIAVWGSSCSIGTGGSSCQPMLAVAEDRASTLTPIRTRASGVIAAVWVTNGGTVLFTVPSHAGRVDVWRAPTGQAAAIWRSEASVWPLSGDRLAIATADQATIVDLATGLGTPLPLPSGVEPSALVSVSPDAEWVAVRGADAIVFQPVKTGGGTRPEVSLPSLAGVSVIWAGGDRYGAVFIGPPPTTIAVRLAK